MIKTINYVPSFFATAIDRFTFSTPYNGISNLAALIYNYTGVQFVADTTGSKWNTKNCGKFMSSNISRYGIPADAYQFITNQIATRINAEFVAGVAAANSDAAFLATLFFNIGTLKTSNWTTIGYTDAISYFGSSNFFIPARFSPITDFGTNITINGVAGLYNANSIADGANVEIGRASCRERV
jgi:hypothetical protein